MSREITYRCDKCGEVITKPRYVMEITDADTGETTTKDLCEKHKNEILAWFEFGAMAVDCVELSSEVIVTPEDSKPKRGRPKKIDEGKIKALYDAGWEIKNIAGDMKITEAQVRHALSFAEKKESDQGEEEK